MGPLEVTGRRIKTVKLLGWDHESIARHRPNRIREISCDGFNRSGASREHPSGRGVLTFGLIQLCLPDQLLRHGNAQRIGGCSIIPIPALTCLYAQLIRGHALR